MRERVELFLLTARENLEDAEVLLSNKRYAATVNRTYYAIFYAASAMLLELDIEVESHYGVKVKFSELFVKTGKVDRRFTKMLNDSFRMREDADYSPEARAGISRTVADKELEGAKDFVSMAETFLEGAGGKRE